ncbi:hypothetical protein DKG34_28640 [Streptomyces sp. NWU49]|nr:hypothetical protein DKG34_28640 [Streptomyces sp. NWU49]
MAHQVIPRVRCRPARPGVSFDGSPRPGHGRAPAQRLCAGARPAAGCRRDTGGRWCGPAPVTGPSRR